MFYIVHIELKSESGSDFVCIVTMYLSRLWSSKPRTAYHVA